MSTSDTERCRCCGALAQMCFRAQLLQRQVQYFECGRCGYVQTQRPDWLAEAYGQALNDSDTGIIRRNHRCLRIVMATLLMTGRLHGRVLDFAGGSGLLVRLLRDAGVQAAWSDVHCQNIFAKGFEHRPGERVDLVAAFEVLEHLEDPLSTLRGLAAVGDIIVLSTELMPLPTPSPEAWWYYGLEHGQHIGFFRVRTLAWLAQALGLHFMTDGQSFHLLSRPPIPNWRWRLARRSSKLLAMLARKRLSSLTMSDHYLIAGRQVTTQDGASSATPAAGSSSS